MIYSDFDYKKQILISRFEGDVSLKEITDYIDATRINKNHPRKLRIITDSRKSNMLLKPEDLSTIVDANNRSLKEYTYIIDAIILENPHDIAMSYLYKELSKTNNYYFKLFSTYDAAAKWLIDFHPTKKIKQII